MNNGEKSEENGAEVRKSSPLRSAVINFRVVGAILMREVITRYGRNNFGVLWVVGTPLIFTVGVTILWNVYGRHGGHTGITITAFAWTGYSTVMIWRNATAHCGKAVEPNAGLLFHRNVKVVDLIYARSMMEIAGATGSTIVVGLVLMGSELIVPPKDVLMMLFGWMLLMWYGFAMGIVVGAMTERFDWFERLYHPAMYFYLGISGCFFMVVWLPTYLQRWAVWVPTVTVTEMLRHGYFGNIVVTYERPGYLCVYNLVTTFIGLLLCKETQYRIGHE
ncbi:MAG TPA: hypothetical protein VEF34_19630 [Syntrophobacteraceae bacterium]|nr:hypothetical protein [Syntrophobacteraceae bacterium]